MGCLICEDRNIIVTKNIHAKVIINHHAMKIPSLLCVPLNHYCEIADFSEKAWIGFSRLLKRTIDRANKFLEENEINGIFKAHFFKTSQKDEHFVAALDFYKIYPRDKKSPDHGHRKAELTEEQNRKLIEYLK